MAQSVDAQPWETEKEQEHRVVPVVEVELVAKLGEGNALGGYKGA